MLRWLGCFAGAGPANCINATHSATAPRARTGYMLRKPPGPKGSNQRAAAVSITIQREHRRTERTLRYVGDWTAGRGRVLGWVGTAGGLHKRLLISSSQFSSLRGVFRYGPPTRLTLTRGPRLCWLALVVALAVHHASAVAVADPPSDPSGAWVTDRYATTVAASGVGRSIWVGVSSTWVRRRAEA